MILSASMLLRHLGLDYHANQVSNAVYNVIKSGRVKTKDMGGHNSTTGSSLKRVLESKLISSRDRFHLCRNAKPQRQQVDMIDVQ
jgi:isocitrate/isopropylmalate dehydrogenase